MTKTIVLVPNPDYHFRKINTIKAALIHNRFEYEQERKQDYYQNLQTQNAQQATPETSPSEIPYQESELELKDIS